MPKVAGGPGPLVLLAAAVAVFCFLAIPVAAQATSIHPSTLATPHPQASGASAGTTVLVAYYSVVGGGTLPPPVLNYVHNGVTLHAALANYSQTFAPDLGSKWSVTQPAQSNSSTERWYTASALSGYIYGFLNMNVAYYHQYLVDFGFTARGGSSGAGSSTVTIASGGRTSTAQTGVGVWADAGSNFTYSQFTAGSNPEQRWLLGSAGAGTVNGPGNFTASYIHQDSFVLAYSVHQGNLSQVPTLTGTSFGAPVSTQLGSNPSVTWLDVGTPFAITNPLQPSTSQMRWYSAGDTSGAVASPENFTLTYFHQYGVSMYFDVSGGNSPGYPDVTGTAFGTEATYYLLETPRLYWFDLGSNYTVSTVLPGSSGSERWVAPAAVTGAAASGESIEVTYYHQYAVSVLYSSALPLSPKPGLDLYSFGNLESLNMSETPSTYWADNGSAISVGSSPATTPGERWGTATSVPAAVEGPLNLTLAFELQVPATISVSGAGVPGAQPYVVVSGSDHSVRQNLTAGSQVIWMAKGANWSLPQALTLGPGARWATNLTLSGIASAPFSVTADYNLQYHVDVVSAPGGNSSVPSGWYQQGKALQLTAEPDAGWVFSGWLGNGTSSYSGNDTSISLTVTGPLSETPAFSAVLTLRASNGGTVAYYYGAAEGKVHGGGAGEVSATPGSSVTLVASPSSFLYQFQGWAEGTSATGNRVIVNLSSPTVMTAVFGLDYYTIAGLGVVAALAAGGFLLYWKNRKRHSILSLLRLILSAAKRYTSF